MAKDVEMADAAAPAPAAAADDKDKAPPPLRRRPGHRQERRVCKKGRGRRPAAITSARAAEHDACQKEVRAADLANALTAHLPSDARVLRDAALAALGSVDTDAAMTDADEVPDDAPVEVEVYLAFLVVAFLVRELARARTPQNSARRPYRGCGP